MEKYIYQTPELEVEREKYRIEISVLESTEGWIELSDGQKEILRVTLYLQTRAQRDMDPDHKNDPWYYDWFRRDKQYTPKYQESLKNIKRWCCHTAVQSLENVDLSGEYPKDPPINFFDADYTSIKSIDGLVEAVESIGFPAVVHISMKPKNKTGRAQQCHSFVIMGHNKSNNLIVWEKQDFHLPYRVTTLIDVYEQYRAIEFWGIRKLR